MEEIKMSVFFATYKYRLKKKSKNEPWKARYKWRSDARLVVCHHRNEVDGIIIQHVKETAKPPRKKTIKGPFEYEVKINKVLKKEFLKEVSNDNSAKNSSI